MKIRSLLLASCAIIAQLGKGAPTQFKTDFSGGIPPEISLFDLDGNTPSTAMAALGFEVGKPWISYYIEEEAELVACSTSWYKPAGTSDDWMVLPAVQIEEGARLKWRAKASDKKYFDGYAVYVSAAGTEPEDFDVTTPLFSIEEESNEWTSYDLDLSEYAGREISVAFVNNSTNKARLYIDDIFIGTIRPLIVTLDMPHLVKDSPEGNDIEIYGHVESQLDDPSVLGEVTITCSATGVSPLHACCATGENFSFPNKLHLPANEDIVIVVTATSASGATSTSEATIRSTIRPALVEEFTGTWCSWCIRGIVYMEALKEKYGDMVIPMCVHESDVMTADDYFDTVDYLSGIAIPNSIVNRRYECDPAALDTWCSQSFAQEINATFTAMEINHIPGSTDIDIDARLAFSRSGQGGDYAVAYVLVEDNVHVPDDVAYCQKNAYAGGAAGPMGGYEDMPSLIPMTEMTYHDVVRAAAAGGAKGTRLDLPGMIEAGVEYAHSGTVKIPSTVRDRGQLTLVGILQDNITGEVLNARSLPLREYYPGGVESVAVGTDGPVSVYTLSGIYLGTFETAGQIDTKGWKFVKVRD